MWAYIHLGYRELLAFDLNRSLQLLFIVIIGGLGSIVGSFFGAAFMVLVPVLLTNVPHMLGLSLAVDTASHIEHMVFGALIVFFLIVEPHGLARSEEHTSELQSLMRISYAVFCLKKKKKFIK